MVPILVGEFTEDLRRLRADLRAIGCYERPFARLLVTWLGMLAVGLGALVVFVTVPFVAARIAALVVAGLAFTSLATLGHTASHGAASDRRALSASLWYATYPLLLQVSARYWHWSHIQLHHPAPNVVGLDADCDLRPGFALNEQHVESGGPRARRWYGVQGYFLPFALLYNGFNIQRQGWKRLIHELRDPRERSAATYADLGCMVLHLLLCVAMPMLFFPAWKVLAVYSTLVTLVGVGMFAVLAPGHYPAAAVCLDESQRDAGDFYLRQAVATVNFRTGWFGSLLCSGLEFQLEHHLFPSLSHVHLRRASPLIKAFCARHGLPHRTLSWRRAVWECYLVFFRPKPVHSDVAALRGALGEPPFPEESAFEAPVQAAIAHG